jgi:superfamily I DNA/RNA helicase
MNYFLLITGSAGTGKTHELAESLMGWYSQNGLLNHQKILAITRMHGSRKRVIERITKKCPGVPCSVTTVDGFALSIINRFRKSIGFDAPILPHKDKYFEKDELGIRADFDSIMNKTAELLNYDTVGAFVSNTYPFVLIDEFQDCTGSQLKFVQALRKYSALVLAADPFQALDGNEEATAWAKAVCDGGSGSIRILSICKRTDNKNILLAAHALYERKPTHTRTIPYWHAPTYDIAVWKTLHSAISGSCALIFPASKTFDLLMKSYERQKAKRMQVGKSMPPFRWHFVPKEDDLMASIKQEICNLSSCQRHSYRSKHLYESLLEAAKNRCIDVENESLIDHISATYVHKLKAFTPSEKPYEALSVHGAKNREFDNVYVLWDCNKMTALSDEQKRRWLYNAITRAKRNCELIAIGKKSLIKNCAALSLLGTPDDIFQKKKNVARKRE